jgi:hypothetical protein
MLPPVPHLPPYELIRPIHLHPQLGSAVQWWAARRDGRPCVVTVPHEALAGDDALAEALARDGEDARKASGPGLLQALAVEEVTPARLPCVEWEQPEAITLGALILAQPTRQLPPASAVRVVRRVAEAVDGALRRMEGRFHPCIAAGTVLILPAGDALLVPPLYRLYRREAPRSMDDALSQELGAPAPETLYEAPDRPRPREHPQALVYELASGLYRLAVGRRAWPDVMAMLGRGVEPHPLPSAVAPELAALDGVIDRATLLDPAARFSGPAALVEALAALEKELALASDASSELAALCAEAVDAVPPEERLGHPT